MSLCYQSNAGAGIPIVTPSLIFAKLPSNKRGKFKVADRKMTLQMSNLIFRGCGVKHRSCLSAAPEVRFAQLVSEQSDSIDIEV